MEISDAIINKAQNWEEEVPELVQLKDKYYTIRQIAVINVKKTSGNSISNHEEIRTYTANEMVCQFGLVVRCAHCSPMQPLS